MPLCQYARERVAVEDCIGLADNLTDCVYTLIAKN
jgi:hypothetical protein